MENEINMLVQTALPHLYGAEITLASGVDFFEAPDGIGVLVRGLQEPQIMRGAAVEHWNTVSERLRNTVRVDELLADTPGADRGSCIDLVAALSRMGLLIVDAHPGTSRHSDAKALSLGICRQGGGELTERLAAISVVVISDGLAGAHQVRSLNESGIENVEWMSTKVGASAFVPHRVFKNVSELLRAFEERCTNSPPDLAICNFTLPLERRLLDVNDNAYGNRTPTLFVTNELSSMRVGPLVLPDRRGCMRCFLDRRRSAARFAGFEAIWNTMQTGDFRTDGSPNDPELLSATAALATAQVIASVAGPFDTLVDSAVVRVSRELLAQERHTFLPVVECETCSP